MVRRLTAGSLTLNRGYVSEQKAARPSILIRGEFQIEPCYLRLTNVFKLPLGGFIRLHGVTYPTLKNEFYHAGVSASSVVDPGWRILFGTFVGHRVKLVAKVIPQKEETDLETSRCDLSFAFLSTCGR
jgi:hypothetical protein